MHLDYHLFFSYARRDNLPRTPGGEGWVTAFARELHARHRRYSNRELRIFFDTQSIGEGRDWRRDLGAGLRSARLFLAFLSPNYLASANCLWEWEEYLRREHSAARGDDGITPIYFVAPPELDPGGEQRLAGWREDLDRRNRSANLELYPWTERGPEILRGLAEGDRSAAPGAQPGAPNDAGDPVHRPDARVLAERLDALDRRIAARLDRIALADLTPGNVVRGHDHFIGRHRELRRLQEILVAGTRGVIATVGSLGGLGKTALARQYAHGYAEYYAAGGTWEIGCEGRTSLGSALRSLADAPAFHRLGEDVGLGLSFTEEQRASDELTAQAVLGYLEAVSRRRLGRLREQLRHHPDRHCPESDLLTIDHSRCLLILDNVDRPELLSAGERDQLPADEWLQVLVTTRLDPGAFGAGARWQAAVEVPALPAEEALELIRDLQPGEEFPDAAEETAARRIVDALGAHTLAVELAAAYLAARAEEGYRPSHFARRLEEEGLIGPVDAAAGIPAVGGAIRHRDKGVGPVLRWSLERLSEPARTALGFASLFQPDRIPLDWLESLTRSRHPDALADRPEAPPAWRAVWNELRAARLLTPADEVGRATPGAGALPTLVRIHRLVAEQALTAAGGVEPFLSMADRFLAERTTAFEAKVGRDDDARLVAEHPWLLEQLDHLVRRHPTVELLRSAGVVVAHEAAHGSVAQALAIGQRILAGFEKRLADQPGSIEAARDVAVMTSQLGDLLIRRGQAGDAAAAEASYQRSLALREQIRAADPTSPDATRDLTIALDRLGDWLFHRGGPADRATALEHYRRSLALREELRAAHPESAELARDVMASLTRMGNCLVARAQGGDLDAALGHYRRGLEIAEELLRASPGSALAERDVAIGASKVADALRERAGPGDLAAAVAGYRRSATLTERLLTAAPDSAQAIRDVATTAIKLGDCLAKQDGAGDWEAALALLERSLALRERLLAADGAAAEAVRNVVTSLNRLAEHSTIRGRPDDLAAAVRYRQRALVLVEQLFSADPASAERNRDLASQLSWLGNALERRGSPADPAAALDLYRRALAIAEALRAANPESVEAARDLLVGLEQVATVTGESDAPDALAAALALQQRAVVIALELAAAHPDSSYHARTAAVSLWLTAQRAFAAGDEALASRSAFRCRELLGSMVASGVTLDPAMRQLYQNLSAIR